MAWQRFNRTSRVFEVSDDNGATWQTLKIAVAGTDAGAPTPIPPNIAFTDQANIFTLPQVVAGAGAGQIIYRDSTQAPNNRNFDIVNTAQLLQIRALDDLNTAVLSIPLLCWRDGSVKIGKGLVVTESIYERGRTAALGEPVPFNIAAAPPTAISVQASCVYSLVGKTLNLQAYLSDTFNTSGGDYALRYYLPLGLVAAASSLGPAILFSSGGWGGWEIGACSIDTGWNYVEVYRYNVQAIPASTTIQARFSISVHVN